MHTHIIYATTAGASWNYCTWNASYTCESLLSDTVLKHLSSSNPFPYVQELKDIKRCHSSTSWMRALAVKWIIRRSAFWKTDTQRGIFLFLVITQAPAGLPFLLYKIIKKAVTAFFTIVHLDKFIDKWHLGFKHTSFWTAELRYNAKYDDILIFKKCWERQSVICVAPCLCFL